MLHLYLFEISQLEGHIKVIIVSTALCGVVMYNYLKAKDVRSSQTPGDSITERAARVKVLAYERTHLIFPYFPFHSKQNIVGVQNSCN